MKYLIALILCSAINLFADNNTTTTSSPEVSNYMSNLEKIFQNQDISALQDISFTNEDKSFINFTNNLINSNILKNSFNGSIPSDLNNYSQAIQNEITGLLQTDLTNNTFSEDSYMKNIKEAFVSGFKEVASNIISSINLTDEEKQNIISGMNEIGDMSQFNEYFDSLSNEGIGGLEGSETFKGLSEDSESLESSQSDIQYSFTCECDSALSDAFDKISEHIITDNLEPLYEKLTTLEEKIQDNIKIAEEQTPLIEKSNKFYAAKIVEAQEYLHKLNLLLQLNKVEK
jgi:hypothetical protein